MKNVDEVVQGVKGLAERFLDQEVKTGMPDLDASPTEVGPEGQAYDEVQDFMDIAQNSSMNVIVAINQMLKPAHKDKLVTLFGENAEELLKQTKTCLEGIAGLFNSEEMPEDEEEEGEEGEEEPEEKIEEPEAEEEEEEDEEEKKKEKK